MKFLVVFVSLAAVAFGFPATTTWTLHELDMALQSPGTDPVLIPYLEEALNQMMYALHHGHAMETITIAMPIVAEYTLQELAAALQDPATNPAHIPYLEKALDKLMAAFYAGEEMASITVVLPADKPAPEIIDVMPILNPEEEPSFIDVWPIQTPELDAPEAPLPVAPTPVAPAASSPLVQIIVNVQKASDVVPGVIERPTPVQVEDGLPGWGNFIERH